MRKISSLKSFYNYYYRREMIKNNPAALVKLPKLHEKEIIRLDVDEVAMLLDEVEKGESLTDKQKAFHNKTRIRDLALLTLLLGTGIRVSECVGLDISDVDFRMLLQKNWLAWLTSMSTTLLAPLTGHMLLPPAWRIICQPCAAT